MSGQGRKKTNNNMYRNPKLQPTHPPLSPTQHHPTLFIFYSRDSVLSTGRRERTGKSEEYAPMSLSRDAGQIHPTEARSYFRNNNIMDIPCSQFCLGYLQSNIACLPSSLADDFEQLCHKNSSAFPHLYRSQPGEFTAPPLASDSDVR